MHKILRYQQVTLADNGRPQFEDRKGVEGAKFAFFYEDENTLFYSDQENTILCFEFALEFKKVFDASMANAPGSREELHMCIDALTRLKELEERCKEDDAAMILLQQVYHDILNERYTELSSELI